MISILYNKIAWFGKHSGYECLLQFLKNNEQVLLFNASENTWRKKIKGKYYQLKYKISNQTTFGLATGIGFLNNKKRAIKHILYLENHLHLLEIATEKDLATLIGTIHLPISQWNERQLNKLQKLQHCILLYEAEINLFKKYMPNAQIKYIAHGVDTQFFKPNPQLISLDKIVCIGHYLRDFDCLVKVFNLIRIQKPKVSLHLIIPSIHRTGKELQSLSKLESVYFHENLSDEELLNYYQSSAFMLMPMKDSGANTAIVQAIACGTPLITTNCGGIKSYGGGTIYPVFERENHQDMADYAMELLTKNEVRLKLQQEMRLFAESTLDWPKIAEQHQQFYNELNS